jgi:hypothetical protein
VQLVVDGGQLLIGRLQLLLGGLQLLVHALELFVPRDELLVGRPEVVVRPAVLFDERLEIFLRRHELVLDLRDPTPLVDPVRSTAPVDGGASTGRGLAGARLLEQHDEEGLLDVRRPCEGEHHQIARPGESVLIDLDPAPHHRGHLFLGFRDRHAQAGDQPGTRHLDDVVLRLARAAASPVDGGASCATPLADR